jgi:glycosyltransferase involved in cell wall biosynthesis
MDPSIAFDWPISLIGHPFEATGQGEDLRCCYRAFKAVGIKLHVVNVYDGAPADREFEHELRDDLCPTSAGGVDIFCINGDEVERVFAHLGSRWSRPRYSLVLPQWELSKFPEPWARHFEKFDEVWAPSEFIRDAVAAAVSRPVTVMPGATSVRLQQFLGRRYFGIRESAYAFLFAFDLRSCHQRQNLPAVIDAFAHVMHSRPTNDAMLVVRIAGSEMDPEAARDVRQRLSDRTSSFGFGRVHVIDRGLTDTETQNLIRCCDCIVSLHRSEGFGRCLAEAMWLGKPVIATGYSGNMVFMNSDVACLVNFRLVPVGEGEYPFWEDQVWADPDANEAGVWMTRLVDHPALGRALGDQASRHIRQHFSHRAVGLRYLDRLKSLRSVPISHPK